MGAVEVEAAFVSAGVVDDFGGDRWVHSGELGGGLESARVVFFEPFDRALEEGDGVVSGTFVDAAGDETEAAVAFD